MWYYKWTCTNMLLKKTGVQADTDELKTFVDVMSCSWHKKYRFIESLLRTYQRNLPSALIFKLEYEKNRHLLRQIFVPFSTNLLNLSEIITKKYLRRYSNDLHQLACHLSWSYNMLSCWFEYSIRCFSMSVKTIREVNKIF